MVVLQSLQALLAPEGRGSAGGWQRVVKISLRAAHVLGAGVFAGGVVLGEPSADLEGWLILLVGAGAAVLVFDVIDSPAFLIQTKGVVVLVKLAVLALIVVSGAGEWLLAPILFASVVSSHAPSSVRHRVLIFRDRVHGGHANG
ncbi:MAG: hypothetical protein DWG75_02800 [Chloroflexi bacterium]|nr:hypothetical protein [Chloroflexota bacterium]